MVRLLGGGLVAVAVCIAVALQLMGVELTSSTTSPPYSQSPHVVVTVTNIQPNWWVFGPLGALAGAGVLCLIVGGKGPSDRS